MQYTIQKANHFIPFPDNLVSSARALVKGINSHDN